MHDRKYSKAVQLFLGLGLAATVVACSNTTSKETDSTAPATTTEPVPQAPAASEGSKEFSEGDQPVMNETPASTDAPTGETDAASGEAEKPSDATSGEMEKPSDATPASPSSEGGEGGEG